jgi:serine/threonine protein kinase
MAVDRGLHPTTLDELERLIAGATDPASIFGDDVEGSLDRIREICRADRHPGQERRARAVLEALERFARFTPEDVAALARAEAVFRSARGPDAPARAPVATITSPAREYALVERIGVGDLADVYLAGAEGRDYVLKVSRIREGARHLEAEGEALAAILMQAGDTHYRDYVPTLVETFPVRDGFPRRVNVFLHEPGFFTLEQVHRRHPELDERHLAWIFNRLLTALGFVHRCGRIHGAIVPSHVLVHAEGHGLKLVGWGHSVEQGQGILTGPAQYLGWYPPEVRRKQAAVPATDIYLAAKCIAYLAGEDPAAGGMPDAPVGTIGPFLRSCLLEGPRMRPDDAWQLLDEFDRRLRDLYGPPAYQRLEMS